MSLRFIVLQMGAMRHYLVPATLARTEKLEKLYTDICGNIGLFKIISLIIPPAIRPNSLERLLGRQLPKEISPSLVKTIPFHAILRQVTVALRSRGLLVPQMSRVEEKLRQCIAEDNFLNANALYTWRNSDLELAIQAKQKGLLVIHDQFLNPDVGYIMREERNLFPNIEKQDNLVDVETGVEKDRQKWEISDLIIVPSSFVRDKIIDLGGNRDRIVVVPFGLNHEWFEVPKKTESREKIRVLCVGSVGLRKGHHYLAKATRVLNQRGIDCDVCVVGPYQTKVIQHPEFRGPNYLGQIPRSQVKQEFMKADIFVLPTLSDSFGLAHLEALACGLPVITTPNCGSVVRDGVDGFIVPIRDPESLASRMEQLLTDHQLRNKMSVNAKERAKEFTWDKYRDRLLSALKPLEQKISTNQFENHR